METIRVIFTCRHCSKTRAFDYDRFRRERTTADGRRVIPVWNGGVTECDQVCPSCGRLNLKYSVVRGRVTPHECGSKCLASKGPACDCSCGGKNHGASYL
jgi:hypothetical protein